MVHNIWSTETRKNILETFFQKWFIAFLGEFSINIICFCRYGCLLASFNNRPKIVALQNFFWTHIFENFCIQNSWFWNYLASILNNTTSWRMLWILPSFCYQPHSPPLNCLFKRLVLLCLSDQGIVCYYNLMKK